MHTLSGEKGLSFSWRLENSDLRLAIPRTNPSTHGRHSFASIGSRLTSHLHQIQATRSPASGDLHHIQLPVALSVGPGPSEQAAFSAGVGRAEPHWRAVGSAPRGRAGRPEPAL